MYKKIFFAFLVTILVSLSLSNCSKTDDFEEITPIKNDTIKSTQFDVTYNNQILSAYTHFNILKIIEVNDGFIIFSHVQANTKDISSVLITKIDNQFNEVWTHLVNETDENSEFLYGVFELGNGEFIAIFNKPEYVGTLFRNAVYGLKFNSTGTIIWKKKYNNYKPQNPSYYYSNDLPVEFDNKSNKLKFIIRTDSVNMNTSMTDKYINEITIDNNFNIINEEILPYDANQGYLFQQVKYDELGNKYVFGGRYFIDFYIDGVPSFTMQWYLAKYDLSNKLLFEKDYGIGKTSEFLDRILLANNKVMAIGRYGEEKNNSNFHRGIFQINNSNGIPDWNIIEDNHLFSSNLSTLSDYIGFDIKIDADGNYIALFLDSTVPEVQQVFNIATVLKINKQGDVIWRFMDGEIENQDDFIPYNIFVKNDEYLIFGLKDKQKLWLKKFKIKKSE